MSNGSHTNIGLAVILVLIPAWVWVALVLFLATSFWILTQLSERKDWNYAGVDRANPRSVEVPIDPRNVAKQPFKYPEWKPYLQREPTFSYVNEDQAGPMDPELFAFHLWQEDSSRVWLVRPANGSDPSFMTENYCRMDQLEPEQRPTEPTPSPQEQREINRVIDMRIHTRAIE